MSNTQERETFVVGSGRRVKVRGASPSGNDRDPIVCPECGNVAQWRRTVYRCKQGHEWHPA